MDTTTTPTTVLDKLGRPITADRIIAGALAAGLRLERGYWINMTNGCCCAGGGLALSVDPKLNSSDSAALLLRKEIVTNSQRFGLSDGFQGCTNRGRFWGKSAYDVCYSVGQEVYCRRHEAGVSESQTPQPTGAC